MAKFGVKISQSGYEFPQITKLCLKAEELGFDSFWVADHMYSWGMKQTDQVALECWTLLSTLSGMTKNIRLGTLVICQLFRHPAVLAKMSSSLDVVSGGRLNLGIGLCGPSTPPELSGFGIPFPKRDERLARLNETLEILHAMWSKDMISFSGKYYKITEALNSPKPVQKPHPPVWIGGEAEDMLALTVKYADGWNCRGYTLEEFKKKVSSLDAKCSQTGRNPETLHKSWQGGILVARNESQLATMKERYPNDRGHRIEGTSEQIVEEIRNYIGAGSDYFMFTFVDDREDMKSLETFIDKVLPNFS